MNRILFYFDAFVPTFKLQGFIRPTLSLPTCLLRVSYPQRHKSPQKTGLGLG